MTKNSIVTEGSLLNSIDSNPWIRIQIKSKYYSHTMDTEVASYKRGTGSVFNTGPTGTDILAECHSKYKWYRSVCERDGGLSVLVGKGGIDCAWVDTDPRFIWNGPLDGEAMPRESWGYLYATLRILTVVNSNIIYTIRRVVCMRLWRLSNFNCFVWCQNKRIAPLSSMDVVKGD
jgi:hypothetical protein